MKKLLFPLAAAALATQGISGQGQVTLRLNLAQGKSYTYVTTSKTSNDMMPTAAMNIQLTQNVKVVSKTANSTTVEFKTVGAKVTSPQGSPASGMASQMEKQAKNAVYKATYDSKGHSSGLTGAGMSQQMGAMQTGFMGIEYPSTPVKVGSSWTTSIDLGKMMGGATGMKASGKGIIVKFTVKKISGGIVNIDLGIGGNLNMDAGAAAKPGTPSSMKMIVSGSGAVVVDAASGLPKSSSQNIVLDMTMGTMKMKQKVISSSVMR